jgi:hypothetical protein
VRLFGRSEALKNHTPGAIGYPESGAAREYSRMESIMSIFSRMLETMTSIDCWTVVGLIELVRCNAPGIQRIAHANPIRWGLLQVTPFFIGAALKENGLRSNLTFSNGISVITPGDEKTMSGYFQDAVNLGKIYLAGHGLNVAAPFLYLALFIHIVRLCNVIESLKARMPFLADGMEMTARFYNGLEEKMPAFKTLEGMTSMDSLVWLGLADLIRGAPPLQRLAGQIPVLFVANDRGFSITRYTLIFLSVLQVAGLGLKNLSH